MVAAREALAQSSETIVEINDPPASADYGATHIRKLARKEFSGSPYADERTLKFLGTDNVIFGELAA